MGESLRQRTFAGRISGEHPDACAAGFTDHQRETCAAMQGNSQVPRTERKSIYAYVHNGFRLSFSYVIKAKGVTRWSL